jgi:hypothetical protein
MNCCDFPSEPKKDIALVGFEPESSAYEVDAVTIVLENVK